MFKLVIAAAALLSLSVGGARAQAPPRNPEECLRAAFSLAEAAERKKLPSAQMAKVEEQLTKMEGLCDARQYNDAMSVARSVRVLIDAQR